MLICHCSDWHGEMRKLPEADIYVVTGDMLPNFPRVRYQTADGQIGYWDPRLNEPWPKGANYFGRELDPDREEKMQLDWMLEHPFQEGTGIRDEAPVICVRGNHDFTDLTPWFLVGNRHVYEINEDPARSYDFRGLRFGGFRGVPPISGEWSDEITEAEIEHRLSQLDRIDVLVTHCPPHMILDQGWENYGSRALAAFHNKMQYVTPGIKAHLFGHVHEAVGKRNLGTLFVNSATTFQLVEL